MSAKPDIDDARWCEEADGTPGANMSEPSSGKKDTGWTDGETPPAEWFNWLAHATFQWLKYVNDGELEEISTPLIEAGNIAHGGMTLDVSVVGGAEEANTGNVMLATDTVVCSGTPGVWYVPLGGLKVGDEIGAMRIDYKRAGGSITFALRRKTRSTGAADTLASVVVSSGTTYTTATIAAINHEVASGESFHLKVTFGASGDELHSAQLDFTRPAP